MAASIGQALELMTKLATAVPWGELDKQFVQGLIADPEIGSEFVCFLRNWGGSVVGEQIIDLEVNPFIPDGSEICPKDQIDSSVCGKFIFDPDQIELHLDSGQEDEESIQGYDLRRALEGQPVLPAHVLDFLLENPHFIPESWEDKGVFFWGTIYRCSGGSLYVRCLRWRGARWCWRYGWLGDHWGSDDPAAVSAS